MIPLLVDPFFGAMAVCIMFGLTVAAILSLIVTPVLYAAFYGVHPEDTATAAAHGTQPA
jgi:multidrug efflux pump subunit AcrB